MAVCIFSGHEEVYDRDLPQRLQAAVEEAAAQNQETEFLFCRQNRFQDLCLAPFPNPWLV